MLVSGALLFLSFWNFNQFENYMVSRLYKMFDKDSSEATLVNFQAKVMSNQKDCILSKTPSCLKCRCCKPYHEECFEIAREEL